MRKVVFAAALLSVALAVSGGVASAAPQPENKIPYPEGYVAGGASSVENTGDHARSPYFTHPDVYNMKSEGGRVLLEKFKTYQQTTEWSCGSAVALMVLSHFKDAAQHTELGIAKIMESVPTPDSGDPEKGVVYGTSTEGMVKFFRHIGYHVRSSLDRKPGERIRTEEEFQNWVLTSLKAGAPIMVEWLDWSEHWAAIIGYDSLGTDAVEDDVLILADPYDVGDHFQDGYHIFPAMRFFYMWRDIRYEQGTDISEQQWLIAAPRG